MRQDKYGRLTIITEAPKDKYGKRCVRCLCDCGNEVPVVNLRSLKTGNTTSCGCYRLEVARRANRTHGKTRTQIYNTWRGMKDRCTNPKATNYSNYGGRGISLCEQWESFETFYQWAKGNGYQPGLTIERSNNDGNYEPGNCRWATRTEQNNNRRSNNMVTFNGVTKPISAWARTTGINYRTLKSRIMESGWPIEQALTVPAGAVKPGPKPAVEA